MKTAERLKARRLRRAGHSLREIERRLDVSRSSVSLWVRDIQLADEQIAELARRSDAIDLRGDPRVRAL
jgi:transposase